MTGQRISLGSGVVVFKNVLEIDKDFLIPYLSDLREKIIYEDFTIIHDENGKELHAVNRSGHRYEIERIRHVNRIMGFATEDTESSVYKFFEECENRIYQCLLRYIEKYPMVLPSIWWKEQGHVVAYSQGSAMGYHSDNDVNYQPGAVPDLQLATRHVLGCIMYFNDSVDSEKEVVSHEYVGGELNFAYLDICYKPQSGDIIFFPSNYMATHEVKDVLHGSRYAYISYFSHGSSDISRGIGPAEHLNKVSSGQVWIPQVFSDYKAYLQEKYGSDLPKHPHLTLPLDRINTSSGTTEEKLKEKARNDLQ